MLKLLTRFRYSPKALCLVLAFILAGATLSHAFGDDSGWPISDEERRQSLEMYDKQKALEAADQHRRAQKHHAKKKPPVKTVVTKKPEPAPRIRHWSAFGGLGLSFVSSSYSLTNSSTTTAQSDSSTGIILDLGASYLFHPHFQLAGQIELGNSNLLILISPRWQYRRGIWTYWAGLGLGLDSISTSGSSAANPAGSSFPSSTTGFAYSPEIGIDRDFGEKYFGGAGLSYVHTSATMASPVSPSIYSSDSVSRHWVSLAVRGGIRF